MTPFDQFWLSYPRKVGKLAALREWDKLRPDTDLIERIRAAVEWQREEWTDPQFIPHPKTWLHQGRWDDEPTVIQKPDDNGHYPQCVNRHECIARVIREGREQQAGTLRVVK